MKTTGALQFSLFWTHALSHVHGEFEKSSCGGPSLLQRNTTFYHHKEFDFRCRGQRHKQFLGMMLCLLEQYFTKIKRIEAYAWLEFT